MQILQLLAPPTHPPPIPTPTHGRRQQVPSLLQPLNGSGAEGSDDLEDRDKVAELQRPHGHMNHLADDGGPLARLLWREDDLGDPLCHLVEPGDHMTDVGGQIQTVLLGPLLLEELAGRGGKEKEGEKERGRYGLVCESALYNSIEVVVRKI